MKRCSVVIALSGAIVLLRGIDYGSANSNQGVSPVRVLDRISLALTGRLASAALKNDYVNGKATVAEAVERLVNSDEFERHAARFWLSVMRIQGIVDFENVRTIDGRTVLQGMSPNSGRADSKTLEWVATNAIPGGGYFRITSDGEGSLQLVADDASLVDLIRNKSTVDCQTTERTFVRNRNVVCPAPYNKFDTSAGSTATAAQKATCKIPQLSAAEINANTVAAWFSDGTKGNVAVCPGVVERCGSALERCFPATNFTRDPNSNGPFNSYVPSLREDFTLEPGMIVSGVIRYNRPWEDVLRTSQAPLSGAMETFLQGAFGGSRIIENMPPGSYRTSNGESVLDPKRFPLDRSWLWKDRGDLHAGVLTTMAFQKTFNGWRAKAAASMEAFMCRAFVVPEGVAVLPSSEVDLTRRPYCQSCHSVLEPLSLFFGRWPNLGNTNYLYSAGSDRVAAGTFEGFSGADTKGLAQIYTSTKDFHSCGVMRAFELMTGRTMSPEEVTALFPRLWGAYQSGGNRILPVFVEIAQSELFARGGK